MGAVLIQVLDSVTFAALLFLVASGFTLIFGLMHITNLAHGAFYLVGGYIGYSVAARATNNLFLGMLAGGLAIGILGVVIERFLLRLVRNQELPEVLLTIGISFMFADLALLIWGGTPLDVPTPRFLSGALRIGAFSYPSLRVFVLVFGSVVAVLMWLLVERTRVGAIVRAGVDDAEMVSGLGINVQAVFTAVFFIGSALAGMSGVIGGAYLALYPGADSTILLYALVVVVIGGLGSLPGAVAGSLVVAFLNTFGQVYVPELSYLVIFGPMAIMLAVHPQGFFGRR